MPKLTVDRNISEWVSLYSDDLYRWAFHKTSDKETAEDLVQETYLAAFKAFDKFQGKSLPKTWLFSIMNNKIMDYHRKRFKSTTYNESQLSGKQEKGDVFENLFDDSGTWNSDVRPNDWQDLEVHLLDNIEFKTVLTGCIKKLPKNWDSAIQFKYLKEQNAKEICKELGITSSNYWQILHRAKLQLRMCLEKNWFKA